MSSEEIEAALPKSSADANAPRLEGAGDSIFTQRRGEAEYVDIAKEWQAKKAEAGYAVIHWPEAVGGRGC